MELIRYLNDGFFTQDQLLAVSGIGAADLADLQRRGVMPEASYRLRFELDCESCFGPHREQTDIAYYARGYASWIGILRSLRSDAEAFAIFAQRYRARLDQLHAAGVRTADPRLGAGLDAHLLAEWKHFLDGTYGLCTKSGLPEDIAAKELAVMVIEGIIGKPEQALTDAERVCLTIAVDLLDTASAMFAPHEAARSSRHRLVDEVRKTYRL